MPGPVREIDVEFAATLPGLLRCQRPPAPRWCYVKRDRLPPLSSMPSYVLVWLLLIFAGRRTSSSAPGSPRCCRRSSASSTCLHAGRPARVGFFYAYVIMQIVRLLGDRSPAPHPVLGLAGGALAAGHGPGRSFAALFIARALTGAFRDRSSRTIGPSLTVTPPTGSAWPGVSFSGPGLGLTFGLVIGGLLVEVLPWRTVDDALRLGPVVPRCSSSATCRCWRRRRRRSGRTAPAASCQRSLWVLGLTGFCAIANQFIWRPGPLFFQKWASTTSPAGSYSGIAGIAPRWDGRQRWPTTVSPGGLRIETSSWPAHRARRIDG